MSAEMAHKDMMGQLDNMYPEKQGTRCSQKINNREVLINLRTVCALLATLLARQCPLYLVFFLLAELIEQNIIVNKQEECVASFCA